MVLQVDAIVSGIEYPAYTLCVQDPQEAYGVLLDLVSQDWTLLKATLLDGDHSHELDTVNLEEAASVYNQAIHELERQWQYVLQTGDQRQHQQVTDYRRLVANYREQIAQTSSLMHLVKELLADNRALPYEQQSQRLLRRFESNLELLQQQLKHRQDFLSRATNRLNRLESLIQH